MNAISSKKSNKPTSNKIFGFIEDLISNSTFQSNIKGLRIKYQIPVNGLECPEEVIEEIKKSKLGLCSDIFYGYSGNKKQLNELRKELDYLLIKHLKEYSLSIYSDFNVYLILLFYFFHDKILIGRNEIDKFLDSQGFCEVLDMREIYSLYKENPPLWKEYLEREILMYPIWIKTMPGSSLEQIKKLWPKINALQEKYKKPKTIGSQRQRKKRDRDDFILELARQGYSSTKIAKMANEKFGGNLVYNNINDIISKARKRRN